MMLLRMTVQKLGYEKYGVLGWSNGGVTGTFLAANSGKCVTKLVIWGAHAYADTKAVIFSQSIPTLLYNFRLITYCL